MFKLQDKFYINMNILFNNISDLNLLLIQ